MLKRLLTAMLIPVLILLLAIMGAPGTDSATAEPDTSEIATIDYSSTDARLTLSVQGTPRPISTDLEARSQSPAETPSLLSAADF